MKVRYVILSTKSPDELSLDTGQIIETTVEEVSMDDESGDIIISLRLAE